LWLENDESNFATIWIGPVDNSYYVGQGEFDPGEDISICKVTWYPDKLVGDITGKTFYCQIWTMSGTSLGTLQGESDGLTGVNAWAFGAVDFEFSTSVNLSNGTDYCIVVTMKEVDPNNYARTFFTFAKTGLDGGTGAWNSDKTRQAWYATYDFKCKIYTD